MTQLGSIDDLATEAIVQILDRAEALRCGAPPTRRDRHVLGLAFFAASTRTHGGFTSAGIRLGMGCMDMFAQRGGIGMSESESLSDSIRAFSAYADVLLLRHASATAWETARSVSECPAINCGCGDGEHPTQALIDLFAIRRGHGRLDGLRIGIVGDIDGSRAAHSLIRALARFRVDELRLMGPPSRLQRVSSLTSVFGPSARLSIRTSFDSDHLDVLYLAGLPEGTSENMIAADVRVAYALTDDRLARLGAGTMVLCPLPRIDEIASAVDVDGRAAYFRQSREGRYVRMSILEHALAGHAHQLREEALSA